MILQDITEGMIEPCVMDIKIGKRTWDPLAGPAKKLKEDFKYKEMKQAHSFCIPGFQYYDIMNGVLHKFDKNYGKKMKPDSIFEGNLFYITYNYKIIIDILSSAYL